MNRLRIWIPEKTNTPEPIPTITLDAGAISGRYEIQLLDKNKSVLGEWAFNNIITNGGMDAIGATVGAETSDMFFAMECGAGSSVPTGTDTALASPLSGRTTNVESEAYLSGSDASGSWYSIKRGYLFSEAQANGNITEVGVHTLSTGGRLVSRALVRDSGGTPITITKTSDNQLRVFYEYRVYVPTGDVTGTFTVGANNYNYTIRLQDIPTLRGWGSQPRQDAGGTNPGGYIYELFRRTWGSATGYYQCSPSGTLVSPTGSISLTTPAQASTVTRQTYVNGNYYIDIDAIWNPSDANFGSTGIRALRFKAAGAGNVNIVYNYQMVFTPNIPKINTQRLTLRFRYGWTRQATSE
jgi:hypothetical protein